MSELPEWPQKREGATVWSEAHYHRDRAEAALARLRVLSRAVRRFMGSDLAKRHLEYGSVDALAEALAQIGDIPE